MQQRYAATIGVICRQPSRPLMFAAQEPRKHARGRLKFGMRSWVCVRVSAPAFPCDRSVGLRQPATAIDACSICCFCTPRPRA
eukprot:4542026-Alexandrium_andersonii.AAC.1